MSMTRRKLFASAVALTLAVGPVGAALVSARLASDLGPYGSRFRAATAGTRRVLAWTEKAA